MTSEVIGNGLFALAAAIVAIAYQYWQYRRDIRKAHENDIATKKQEIIERLISYRYVLTPNGDNDAGAVMAFNAALSAIPIHFSHCKECMDKYRTIGTDFTSTRFYDLIVLLMKDVPLGVEAIDVNLLENVPKVKSHHTTTTNVDRLT